MSEILVTDITTEEEDGVGIFDALMRTVDVRLENEYTKNRIKGVEYSKVFLESMESVMSQSMAFVLGKQAADKQADLLSAQIQLTDAQRIGIGFDNDLKQEQLIKLSSEILLINQNIINAGVQETILQQQALRAAQEVTLGVQEIILAQKKVLLSDQEISLAEKEVLIKTQQELLTKDQILKTVAETALIAQNDANAVTTNGLITQQITKVLEEGSLINQKKNTETAQTQNTAHPDSILGKQSALYQQQTDGFKRDAEQKLAKLMVDSWSVRRSTNDAEPHKDTGLDDANIRQVLATAMVGIGDTQTPPPA